MTTTQSASLVISLSPLIVVAATQETKRTPNIPLIAGLSSATAALFCCGFFACFFHRRRTRHAKKEEIVKQGSEEIGDIARQHATSASDIIITKNSHIYLDFFAAKGGNRGVVNFSTSTVSPSSDVGIGRTRHVVGAEEEEEGLTQIDTIATVEPTSTTTSPIVSTATTAAATNTAKQMMPANIMLRSPPKTMSNMVTRGRERLASRTAAAAARAAAALALVITPVTLPRVWRAGGHRLPLQGHLSHS